MRVAYIVNKMRKARVSWFRHVKRGSKDSSVRRCEKLMVIGLREIKDRPGKNWRKIIRQNIMQLQLIENMILDRRA